ncbi:ABC-type multidrug transport system permease component [Furfurilactobacillus rossiae]|uniref:ABC transporter permease n=1 Tax=Furfurilactobacillus rossiae TaxID=231049 RepID=UPI0015BC0E2C|nr:ABC transporter permease [Furfurilactobacillus rossiae]QLE65252.1 ABC-type multidrug transport system permease component [Furfurilactobacillus rossiae]
MYKLSLRSIKHVIQRNYMSFRKLFKVSVFPNLLDPILYLIAMGIGLANFVGNVEGMPYFLFVTSGLVAATSMNAATNEATTNAFIQMRVEKTYYAVSMTPVNLQDIIIGQAIWAGIRATIFGTLFLIIAGFLGAIHSWLVIFVPFLLFLNGLLFGLLGLIFTLLVPNRDYLNYYAMLVIQPMYMFSDTFFPVANMPRWLQPYCWLSPLYHAVKVCRGLMLGNPTGIWFHLGWLLVVVILIAGLPIYLVHRRLVY